MRMSVAVPVFNEESNVPELVRRIGAALDGIEGGPHEMVFVDDGSADRTLQLLRECAACDPRIVIVTLSRNFGHQAALSAALDFVTGDVTVLLDGDLQDPPELLPRFLERYAEGYDVVFAERRTRQEGWLLRTAYHAFYRVLHRLSDISIPMDAGDCALLSRRVVEALRNAPERQRFLRGLRSWVGFRQIGMPVDRAARHAGSSKYTFGKLMRLAFDGLLAFSTVPIRAAAFLGGIAILASTAFAIFAVIVKLVSGRSPQGFTSLTVLLTFSSGVQLLFLGVIGEYVGRVYEEVKRRPLYIVSEVIRGRSGVPDSVGQSGERLGATLGHAATAQG